MPNLRLDGNVVVQLTESAKDANVPLRFTLAYTQKAMLDLVYAGAETNTPIADGTITTPKFIVIEVYEGAMSFAFDASGSAGTGKVTLDAGASPIEGSPARLVFCTYGTTANALYVTTTAPAKGRVWFFQ